MISTRTLRSLFLAMASSLASIGVVQVQAADTPPAKAAPANAPRQGSDALLARFKSAVYDLKLTNDQKAKIDPLFESARGDLKGLESTADEKERATKSREVFTRLRAEVGEVLTNEQKLSIAKTMAPPGPGAVIDKIKAQLHKPEMKLTDEQKTKVDVVLDDTKARLEDLKSQVKAGGGAKEAGTKAREILTEMRGKLTEILSPDQQAHLNAQPTSKTGDAGKPKE